MADDSDNRSSRQDTEGSSQRSSNQGTPISFDVEGDMLAIANRPMMNAHRKPPDPSQFQKTTLS
jgi:hypothetical protein